MTTLREKLEAWIGERAISSGYQSTYDRARMCEGADALLDLLMPVIEAAERIAVGVSYDVGTIEFVAREALEQLNEKLKEHE